MPNELKPCPYCNGEYVNSPDGHYVHPFNDCDDRGRILQTEDIAWFNQRPIEEALNSEIKYLTELLDSCKYSDAQHRGKCKKLQAIIDELQKDNAELNSFLNIGEQLDHLLEAYGLSDEKMTEKAIEIKAWMQKHVIEPKAHVAELEKQIAHIRANSRSKLELDTCRSLNEALRAENMRLIAENKKLKERFGCAKQKN